MSHTFLFEMHSNSRIAQIASEQQQRSVPEGDIVLVWDGDRLNFVLLYLQGEGYITLPKTLLKRVFLDYLAHYGIINVDESKITRRSYIADLYSRNWKDEMRAEIKSWSIRIGIALLAQVCAVKYLTSGEKRRITIQHDDFQTLSRQGDSPACSLKLWMQLRTLLLRKGKKKFCPAREECNQYLRKVGLKIVGVTEYQSTSGTAQIDSAMEVAMQAEDNDSDTSDEANAFACSIERNK